MSRVGVSLKIDVTNIDKARLFKGQKGTYLDATVFIDLDEADQYGNHGMITQDVTKEERQSGTRGEILGNCKVFYRDGSQQQQQGGHRAYGNQPPQQQAPMGGQQQQPQQPQGGQGNYGAPDPGSFNDFDDEIPFN